MSLLSRSGILWLFVFTLFDACNYKCLQGQVAFRLHYKVVGNSMIVVPIHINNSKPLDFLLDTGTSRTIIDRKLAEQLGLVKVGEQRLSGVQGSAAAAIFQSASISMAGMTVKGLRVSSRDSCPMSLRGVLGEDFLHNFDLLIDYREHEIEFEPIVVASGDNDAGVIVSGLMGERLPLELEGHFEGHETTNRLTLSIDVPELRERPMLLLLDSGADSFMVFNQAPSSTFNWQKQTYGATSFFSSAGSLSASVRSIPYLKLGSQGVSRVSVTAPVQRVEADVDGVLPTLFFHSLFISHSGRFVILNPERKRPGVVR